MQPVEPKRPRRRKPEPRQIFDGIASVVASSVDPIQNEPTIGHLHASAIFTSGGKSQVAEILALTTPGSWSADHLRLSHAGAADLPTTHKALITGSNPNGANLWGTSIAEHYTGDKDEITSKFATYTGSSYTRKVWYIYSGNKRANANNAGIVGILVRSTHTNGYIFDQWVFAPAYNAPAENNHVWLDVTTDNPNLNFFPTSGNGTYHHHAWRLTPYT